jgi:very-short-patch-repair endonuclease
VHQRQFAKHLRTTMTEAEHRLWFHLRAHRFAGFKFRRQQPVGHYVVDFISFSERMIIEADGGQHNASGSDRTRDAWLEREGFRVLRFWNHDILQNTQAVLDAIWNALRAEPSPPAPLPQGERGARQSPSPLAGEGLGRGESHTTDE